ncbi:hypothetical protein EYC84_009092 [Monilinia fructicola]|uniref:Uncharacterized protein n=1 Tax=Monilinia fructicola TaxID=38448 RepID=A0A5M9JBB7_MONFR|nr:hypothetical protein EYC84_009092 [Monilinia fructicola]
MHYTRRGSTCTIGLIVIIKFAKLWSLEREAWIISVWNERRRLPSNMSSISHISYTYIHFFKFPRTRGCWNGVDSVRYKQVR